MEFIEIDITPEMVAQAKKRSDEMGKLRNSITRGEGNVTGFIGELVVKDIIKAKLISTHDYDLVDENGVTWDAKSKRCSSKPQEHYDCSISDYNTKQKCDNYIFVRVLNDYSKAWVLGYLPKDEYYKKAVFVHQGQVDPSNGWRAKCDCWNLKINELIEIIPPDTLKASV